MDDRANRLAEDDTADQGPIAQPRGQGAELGDAARRLASAPFDAATAALGGDWPVKATDAVERVVGAVRSKTTGPALLVSRGIVYGLVAAVLGVASLVLLIILAVRVLTIPFGDNVWITYLILGFVFFLIGAVLWSKRS
ncbi:MAG: hypothetical protein ACKVWR_12210 [Acidimicrobiales bacterium]